MFHDAAASVHGSADLTGTLFLRIDGVGADGLERGRRAAHDVFRAHGVTPAEADHGRWRRDLCEALGLAADPLILTRRDALSALAWDDAVRAALAAARAGDARASAPDVELRLATPADAGHRFEVEPVVETGR